MVLDPNICT